MFICSSVYARPKRRLRVHAAGGTFVVFLTKRGEASERGVQSGNGPPVHVEALPRESPHQVSTFFLPEAALLLGRSKTPRKRAKGARVVTGCTCRQRGGGEVGKKKNRTATRKIEASLILRGKGVSKG